MVREGFLKEEVFELGLDTVHRLDKEKRVFPVEGPAWVKFRGMELARFGEQQIMLCIWNVGLIGDKSQELE